jgi:hypothetical protein
MTCVAKSDGKTQPELSSSTKYCNLHKNQSLSGAQMTATLLVKRKIMVAARDSERETNLRDFGT